MATKEGTVVEQEEENHHCESVTADIGQTTKDPLLPTTVEGAISLSHTVSRKDQVSISRWRPKKGQL